MCSKAESRTERKGQAEAEPVNAQQGAVVAATEVVGTQTRAQAVGGPTDLDAWPDQWLQVEADVAMTVVLAPHSACGHAVPAVVAAEVAWRAAAKGHPTLGPVRVSACGGYVRTMTVPTPSIPSLPHAEGVATSADGQHNPRHNPAYAAWQKLWQRRAKDACVHEPSYIDAAEPPYAPTLADTQRRIPKAPAADLREAVANAAENGMLTDSHRAVPETTYT